MLRARLRGAVRDCSDRGLLVAAHWAASMLNSMLPADATREGAGEDGDDDGGGWPPAASGAGAVPSSSLHARMTGGSSDAASDDEADLFLLAKTALDCRAYHRAAHVTAAARGPRTRFIHWYSMYMAGEQQRDDAAYEQGDLLEGANNRPVNANALPILNELRAYREQLDQAAASDARRTTRRAPLGGKAAEPARRSESLDGFCLYLLGVVYNDLDNKERAAQALIESVCAYPFNWSAWLLLATVAPDASVIDQVQQSLDLSDAAAGTMLQLFAAHTLLAHQQNEQARQLYEELMQTFPSSTYVRGQIGLSYYNVRDFESAGAILSEVVADDPHGLQYVDVLSNILYVSEEREKLAELARQVQGTDRYRPETCCVIGNYYSSKGEHERAIKYFVRALRLNPSYLSAWTLMGHEFVEMRNAAAAVQAYRRAVDLDPRDYRAWYGLGQTYELLQMPLYALHYFRKAAALRPFDSRMWCAMAECYVALERRMDAIRCFERAVENVDREGIALSRLARLYHELGDTATAAKYYEMHVQAVDEQRIDMDVSEAMIYLAHHYKHVGNLDAAEQTCQRLLVARSESEREEARSLLRELQAIRAQQQK